MGKNLQQTNMECMLPQQHEVHVTYYSNNKNTEMRKSCEMKPAVSVSTAGWSWSGLCATAAGGCQDAARVWWTAPLLRARQLRHHQPHHGLSGQLLQGSCFSSEWWLIIVSVLSSESPLGNGQNTFWLGGGGGGGGRERGCWLKGVPRKDMSWPKKVENL